MATKYTRVLIAKAPAKAQVTKAQMIANILGAARQSAIAFDRLAHFEGNAADAFISLAFKSEGELRAICEKVGASY